MGVVTKMSDKVLDGNMGDKKINVLNLKTNERFESNSDKLIRK